MMRKYWKFQWISLITFSIYNGKINVEIQWILECGNLIVWHNLFIAFSRPSSPVLLLILWRLWVTLRLLAILIIPVDQLCHNRIIIIKVMHDICLTKSHYYASLVHAYCITAKTTLVISFIQTNIVDVLWHI